MHQGEGCHDGRRDGNGNDACRYCVFQEQQQNEERNDCRQQRCLCDIGQGHFDIIGGIGQHINFQFGIIPL